MPKPVNSCKICGRSEFHFLFKNRDRMHPLPGEFDFYRCDGCGLVTYEPALLGEALARHYPKDYYSYEAAENGAAPGRRGKSYYLLHPFQAANALFYSKILAQNRDGVFRPGQTVLDVGCGDGGYLLQPNKSGCRRYGVDIDAAALQKLKKADPSAVVFCGNLWEAGWEKDFFDHIQLSHVVEHVGEADQLLREVGRLARPDGSIRLQIPNTASLTRRLSGRFWIHWDAPRHIYGFSRKNFERLCGAAGLEVVRSRTIENSFSMLGSLLYLANALTGKKTTLTAAARFWDSEILKCLLFPYCLLVNLLGVGDTAEFVLKKRAA